MTNVRTTPVAVKAASIVIYSLLIGGLLTFGLWVFERGQFGGF